jgi:precorrin-3B synthase
VTAEPLLSRVREDACPGVLRLTEAADGFLARVRLPGGFLTSQGFSSLASAATELGDGRLELTSRGNVQLRGLASDAGAELGERLASAGLWPSVTHERVRNIVASPLAGLDSPTSLEPLVRALDEALCASPRMAQLSGRFLFAVDDGRGDVAGLGADFVLRPYDTTNVAIAFAEAFLDECEARGVQAWRVADLRPVGGTPASDPPPVGPFERFDGGTGAVLAVPLGRLNVDQLTWLTARASRKDNSAPENCPYETREQVRVTPWRSIVLPHADAADLADARALGFGVDAETPWANVTACAGRPGCAKSHADVQADARAALTRWPGRVVHWSGCERRCGRPARTQIDLVATPNGYRETNA